MLFFYPAARTQAVSRFKNHDKNKPLKNIKQINPVLNECFISNFNLKFLISNDQQTQ